MRKNKWLFIILLFFIEVFDAQIEREIDTINIAKKEVVRSVVASQLKKEDLAKHTGGSLAKIISNISGVSMLQTGHTNAKPVIQGLSGQRIAILNNGVKIESQQWGDDHSPEIDPFIAQNIEVIKGAEAVKYGSNALGGVILLNSEKLPYYGEKLGGKFQMTGESNGDKWSGNLSLKGNISNKNAFAWQMQYSAKKSGDYKTAEYLVNNTGVRESNYSANIGYQMEKEKVEMFYSYFSTELGVFKGSRIGSPLDWDLRLSLGRPISFEAFKYDIESPKQMVNHHLAKILVESKRNFAKLNLVYTFQKNHRQEYDVRRGLFADRPTLDVELTTQTISLDFDKEFYPNFRTLVGGVLSTQKNYNIPGNGINSIIPNFISDNFGVYVSQEYNSNSWILNAGLRFDYKTFSSAGYDRIGRYYSGNKKYQNWSYVFGVNKTFGEKFQISSNIGMAWRAPEAVELFSNGVHHGSAFYLEGNPNLELERGLKWSSKIQYSSKKVDISADVFLQRINGFIYEMPTKSYFNTWGGYFPLFKYKQSDAFFRGMDFNFKYTPIPDLEYRLKASVIYADNLSESYYFPHISPENIQQDITLKLSRIIPLKKAYFNLEHHWTNKQKRFSLETDLLPNSPPAYHLINISMGTNISIFKENDMMMSLSVNNLLNNLYKDYTDRLRYFVHSLGRKF